MIWVNIFFSFVKLVLELLRYLLGTLNYQFYTLFHTHLHALYGLRWWGNCVVYLVEGGMCLQSIIASFILRNECWVVPCSHWHSGLPNLARSMPARPSFVEHNTRGP